MKRTCIITILCLILNQFISASDLIDVLPVSNTIIRLHFKDGAIEYLKTSISDLSEKITNSPLDLTKASYDKSYRISSIDDTDFSEGIMPVKIGRKTKGNAFSADYSKGYPHVNEHFIYLVLPNTLKHGFRYKVELGWLAENINEVEFVFDASAIRSDAIHVNQIGYVPDARIKYGYIYSWLGDLGPLNLNENEHSGFYLVDVNTHEIKFTGTIELRKSLENDGSDTYVDNSGPYKNFCGADVYVCDFSTFKTPGEYKLVVENIGCSYPFTIENDIYREAFYSTCRGLFHHRSGPARTKDFSDWTKGIDHFPEVNNFKVYYSSARYIDINVFDNTFTKLTEKATSLEMPQAWGGWFDAGDWDRNFVHLIASNYLLFTYEFSPWKFSDNELDIPESNNGIPDIIDEAKWCIDLFRRLKGPTGGICGGIEAEEHPIGSDIAENDRLQWYTYGEDPAASFLLSASVAQLAYCLEIAGITDSTNVLLAEAKDAYNWAQNNMVEGDIEKVKYFKMFASAWLFKCTGEKSYENEFKEDKKIEDTSFEKIAFYKHFWGDLPDFAYLTANRQNTDTTFYDSLLDEFVDKVKLELISSAKNRSCPVASFNMYRPQLIGAASTPLILPLMVAFQLTKDSVYLDYSYTTCDYFLGANPLNLCYVTGLGENSPNEIMNRESWFDNIYQSVPGIVPFGYYHYPNEKNDQDPWSSLFTYKTCYPDYKTWPVHELFLENRYSYLTNEYTVWQTQGIAVSAYAFLCDTAKNYIPNRRPVITFELNSGKTTFNDNDTLTFNISTFDDKKIDKIELYNGWHKIEELQGNSSVYSGCFSAGKMQIYAKVFDNQGAYNFSDTIYVEITSSSPVPKVTISNPLNNSEIIINEPIIVQCTVINNAPIAIVEIFDGLEKIDEKYTAPYNFNYTPTRNGISVINIVATDINGRKGTASVKLLATEKTNIVESTDNPDVSYSFYPNPFKNTINIVSSDEYEHDLYLVLYSEDGNILSRSSNITLLRKYTLHIPNISLPDIVLYSVFSTKNDAKICSGKLIYSP